MSILPMRSGSVTRIPVQPFTRNLLVLDVETTGSDPLTHEIVEIGAVLLDRATLAPVRNFDSLVRPNSLSQADPKAMEIHGLSFQLLSAAPPPAEVIQNFANQ